MHSSRMRTVSCSGRLGEGCLTRGARNWPGLVWLGGCAPPPRGLTDTCKNITFPQLLLRTITSFLSFLTNKFSNKLSKNNISLLIPKYQIQENVSDLEKDPFQPTKIVAQGMKPNYKYSTLMQTSSDIETKARQ